MQLYFVKKEQISLDKINMSNDDSYHIVKVMRMNIGDKIEVSDEENSYLCEIESLDIKCVVVKIIKTIQVNSELNIDVCIAQGYVMRSKMELVIEQCAMLGASEYLFFPMERSSVKINDEKSDKKMLRLEKIAKEASEVAHRNKILKITSLKNFKEFIDYANSFDYVLYAYELTEYSNINYKKTLKEIKNIQNNKIKLLVLIGPEGGISEKEVKILNSNRFLPITLGPRILRTELAPVYVMSSIGYELEIEE